MKSLKYLASLAAGICLLSSSVFAGQQYTLDKKYLLPIYLAEFDMFKTLKFNYCSETPNLSTLHKMYAELKNERMNSSRFNHLIDSNPKDGIISELELLAFHETHCSRASKSN